MNQNPTKVLLNGALFHLRKAGAWIHPKHSIISRLQGESTVVRGAYVYSEAWKVRFICSRIGQYFPNSYCFISAEFFSQNRLEHKFSLYSLYVIVTLLILNDLISWGII